MAGAGSTQAGPGHCSVNLGERPAIPASVFDQETEPARFDSSSAESVCIVRTLAYFVHATRDSFTLLDRACSIVPKGAHLPRVWRASAPSKDRLGKPGRLTPRLGNPASCPRLAHSRPKPPRGKTNIFPFSDFCFPTFCFRV